MVFLLEYVEKLLKSLYISLHSLKFGSVIGSL
jgi:hypothetical protein